MITSKLGQPLLLDVHVWKLASDGESEYSAGWNRSSLKVRVMPSIEVSLWSMVNSYGWAFEDSRVVRFWVKLDSYSGTSGKSTSIL